MTEIWSEKQVWHYLAKMHFNSCDARGNYPDIRELDLARISINFLLLLID